VVVEADAGVDVDLAGAVDVELDATSVSLVTR